MKRINILDDITINKIAAGEVVERPSSVLKELVENSIDAGATKVTIEIIDGGKELIKIVDNGEGIASSEVDKTFMRHATSKIKNVDDLYEIFSLGFRGEAMSSISAVSKLEMTTKTKDELVGTNISLAGGVIESKEAVGAPNGTTITVKELFFNTPARQKFLKSAHAETINISDWINKLAISHPAIQFKYINNGRNMLSTPGDGNLLNAVRSVYGREVADNLVELEFESRYFKLNGFTSDNNLYRSNKNLQHIYINGRFVKSKVVLNTVYEAYKSLIPIGKHAVCFISLEVDPAKVDINIHPNKLEVKFEKEHEIYIELRDYIKERLLRSNLIGKYQTYSSKGQSTSFKPPISPLQEIPEMQGMSGRPGIKEESRKYEQLAREEVASDKEFNYDDLNKIHPEVESQKTSISQTESEPEAEFKSLKDILTSASEDNQNTKVYDIQKVEDPLKNEISKLLDTNESVEKAGTDILKEGEETVIQQTFENLHQEQETGNDSNESNENQKTKCEHGDNLETKYKRDENSEKLGLKEYRVLGIIFRTYIVLEKCESMYLLDQHAAHERVLFEKYMKKFLEQDINMQMLLEPIVMEVSTVDMLQVEANLDLFMRFGFEVEIFGSNNILIRSVPTIFGVPETEKFILQIIDNIDDITSNYELKVGRFATMACRSAIKANDKIGEIEVDALFEQLEKCDNPFTCPHGRPIIVEISKYEIEKMFKRVQ
ncbi:MAG: DNA mismatch repair endonuclease MutL [Clostridioides sp.]|jgi:DNA mismatch repair protein MutL|nr:DNA mismatch repair endonuclease MutL [Clostridioides sp.]